MEIMFKNANENCYETMQSYKTINLIWKSFDTHLKNTHRLVLCMLYLTLQASKNKSCCYF